MKLLFVLLLVSLPLSLHAGERPVFVADGYANLSCGMYLEERKKDSIEYYMFKSWLKGYMTGLSQERAKDIRQDRDYEGMLAWLENYCKANPLKFFVQASSALEKEINK